MLYIILLRYTTHCVVLTIHCYIWAVNDYCYTTISWLIELSAHNLIPNGLSHSFVTTSFSCRAQSHDSAPNAIT